MPNLVCYAIINTKQVKRRRIVTLNMVIDELAKFASSEGGGCGRIPAAAPPTLQTVVGAAGVAASRAGAARASSASAHCVGACSGGLSAALVGL